jgi:hypothetical protein
MALVVRSGPWTADEVRGHLADARIPLRLASSGTFPLVQSLWFVFDDDALWCATQADSVVARRLARDDHCGFEVCADQPPYRGVRGTGRARIVPAAAADVLPQLIARYVGDEPTPLSQWLLSRLDTEVAIRVGDLTVTSWDYSGRM